MIVGTGIDIVEVERIESMIEKHGTSFLSRTFTEQEICLGQNKGLSKSTYYAGRWAAKEATAKALGCGFSKDCNFLDIDVANDSNGKPILSLTGPAAARAEQLGVKSLHITISHENAYAVAMVILEN